MNMCTCVGRVALSTGHTQLFNVHVNVGVAWGQSRELGQLSVAT